MDRAVGVEAVDSSGSLTVAPAPTSATPADALPATVAATSASAGAAPATVAPGAPVDGHSAASAGPVNGALAAYATVAAETALPAIAVPARSAPASDGAFADHTVAAVFATAGAAVAAVPGAATVSAAPAVDAEGERRSGRRVADVGAAEGRARSLRRRLAAPLATTAVLHVVLAVGDRLPAVDGLAYFEAGRNLLGGRGYSRAGGPELHFPPLVPVCLRLLELATGSEMAALGAWNVLTSLAALAALVALAHRLWHDDGVTVAAAWLGGTMAGLGPLFFRHGSGSEAASLALLLWAVLLTLWALDDRSDARLGARGAWLGGSGLLVGLAYLARPEALLPGAVVGFVTLLWTARHAFQHPGSASASGFASGFGGVRAAAGRWVRRGAPVVAAFGLGVVVLVAPYAVYLHANTGEWSLTAKSQDVSIEAWRAVAEGHRRERDSYLYALNPDGTLGADTRPLTALAAEDPAAWAGIVGVNAVELARTYLAPLWGYGVAWDLIPAPLLLLALLELGRQRRRPGALLLAGVALVPVATCLAFFTLPRYLAVPTAVVTLFAAKGLVGWQRRLPRRWAAGLVAVVVVLVAMSCLTEARSFLPGGRTADPVDQRAAGEWIEANTPADARVMTRSFHVQAYAHRPIVAMPVADLSDTLGFAREMGVTYLVLDSRSALYPMLQVGPPLPGLRPLAAIGSSRRPIRVYELDPPPPPSDRAPLPLGYVGD